jgi:hypothetical protein
MAQVGDPYPVRTAVGRVSRGDALARLRQALEDHGCQPKGSSARCPAHDDQQPSLSIGQAADDGKVLVYCQAGCSLDEILAALSMSAADLFDDPLQRQSSETEIARYHYADRHGNPAFDKIRYRKPDGSSKGFYVQRPDGRKGIGDAPRVLYRLPGLLAAVAAGQHVWLVEGEKDADRLASLGETATCNFDGAAKNSQRPKWRAEYNQHFAGADVTIIADRDPAGYAHARAARDGIAPVAKSVRIVQSATDREHDDVSDHLNAGYSLGGLVPVGDGQDVESGGRAGELRGALLDSAALDQLADPEPLIDGILYRDSLAWLHGKPGHGKSFVALDWAACVSTGLPWQMHGVTQGQVLYVIAEGVSGLRQRVRAWEDHAGLRMQVTFLPMAVQLLNPADVEALIMLAADLEPVLIVIDTQARVTAGADENSAKDMGELVAAVDRIRIATRACILPVHHEARNGENMRGSTALEGAATTQIRVTKDGPVLTVTNPKQKDAPEFDRIRLWLIPRLESVVLSGTEPVGLTGEYTDSEQKIIDTLRDSFGTTGAPGGKLFDVAAVPKTSYYRALNRLVSTGAVINTGTRKRPHYQLPESAEVPQSHLVPLSPTEIPVPSPKSHHPFRGGTSGTETPAEPAVTEPDQ